MNRQLHKFYAKMPKSTECMSTTIDKIDVVNLSIGLHYEKKLSLECLVGMSH